MEQSGTVCEQHNKEGRTERSVANRETMSYLTAPLREVTLHHLKPDETVLTAIYAHHTILPARGDWLWLTWYRQVHHPARAFVLTTQRALIPPPLPPTASISLPPAHSTVSCSSCCAHTCSIVR